jgi:hypothetical protein
LEFFHIQIDDPRADAVSSAVIDRQGTDSIRTDTSQGRGANMARIGDRIRAALDHGLGFFLSSVLVLAVALSMPAHCEAARLGEFLTRKDLSRPVLLDQNGSQLQLPSAMHPHPSLTQGSTPTYLALPLYGGEHLPVATATIDAGAQAGNTGIGPLDLSTLVKAELNAALNTSGLALVDTSKQNYLVEYLPHTARLHQGSGTASVSSPATPQTTTSSSTSNFSKLFSASQWNTWTKSGLSDLKKLLNINSSSSGSGRSASKPSLNLEAQVVGPDSATSGTGAVLPSPVPEPSAWMVFALVLAAGALATHIRRGRVLAAV